MIMDKNKGRAQKKKTLDNDEKISSHTHAHGSIPGTAYTQTDTNTSTNLYYLHPLQSKGLAKLDVGVEGSNSSES